MPQRQLSHLQKHCQTPKNSPENCAVMLRQQQWRRWQKQNASVHKLPPLQQQKPNGAVMLRLALLLLRQQQRRRWQKQNASVHKLQEPNDT